MHQLCPAQQEWTFHTGTHGQHCFVEVTSKYEQSQKILVLAFCDLSFDLPQDSSFEHSAHYSLPPRSVFPQPDCYGGVLSSGHRVRNGVVQRLEGEGFWEMVGNCRKSHKCSVSPFFEHLLTVFHAEAQRSIASYRSCRTSCVFVALCTNRSHSKSP